MKKLGIATLLLGLVIIAITSQQACYYDNEEELYGGCDTTGVKYSGYVASVINSQCLICHAPGGSQESTPLDSYAAVKAYVDNGLLIQRLHDDTNPMPPSGRLPACDLNKIQAWINQGAPHN